MTALALIALLLMALFVWAGWPALAVVIAAAALMVVGALMVLRYSPADRREEL